MCARTFLSFTVVGINYERNSVNVFQNKVFFMRLKATFCDGIDLKVIINLMKWCCDDAEK